MVRLLPLRRVGRDHQGVILHCLPKNTRNVFALLAFAAGFIVRPFGAPVFGALGDRIGRKYVFSMTIVVTAVSTFLVEVLPNCESFGLAAPVILISLRMVQGLALGGE